MDDAVTAKTAADLQAIIAAPKLTDKLLRKPPFRFLHDITTNFLKATGFPNGLYSETELDSSKMTEKDAKIDFLQKLVTVVGHATGAKLQARPSKIVSGLEPEHTNELLQQLAACSRLSKDKIDAAVKKTLGGGGAEAPPAPKQEAPKEAKKESPPPQPAKKEEPKPEAKEEKKREERKKEPKPAKEEKSAEGPASRFQQPPPTTPPQAPPVVPLQPGERPGTATARKPPPAVKSNEVIEDTRPVGAAAAGVIVEESTKKKGEAEDKEANDQSWMKFAEQAENQGRQASTTGDQAAQGYLAQEALQAKQLQEEQARKTAEDTGATTTQSDGIVLKSRKRTDKHGNMGESEVGKLRESLQMLTKATNPLGKFLESIYDDVDTMSRELEMWRTEARTQATAAEEAQRQTEEALHQTFSQLHDLEDAINDQLLKISSIRANILANDKTIENLLRMVVSPEFGGRK